MTRNYQIYKFHRDRRPVCLYLGGLYTIYGRLVRFIKVTEKGFNFLDEATNKCVLRKHLYSRKHYGIPLPANVTQVHTYIKKDVALSERVG